jgi:hypothetical protein
MISCPYPENLVRHLRGVAIQVYSDDLIPNLDVTSTYLALTSPDTRCWDEFGCSVILPRPATLKNAQSRHCTDNLPGRKITAIIQDFLDQSRDQCLSGSGSRLPGCREIALSLPTIPSQNCSPSPWRRFSKAGESEAIFRTVIPDGGGSNSEAFRSGGWHSSSPTAYHSSQRDHSILTR